MEPRKIITNGNRISRDFQEVRCGRELCSGCTNNGIGHDVATVTKDDFSKNTHSTPHHMAIRAGSSEVDRDTEEEPKESNILNIFDHLDHSVLQTPFSLGVPSVSRVLQYLRNGTQEVKDVILNECNLIYECKVCRSLFRSLANLLAHKRFYCKKFSNESFGYIDKKASLSVSDKSVKKRSNLDAHKDLTSDETSPPHIYCCNSSVQTEENKERDVTGIPIVKESSFYIDSLQKDLKKKICYEEIAVDLKPIEGNSNAVFQVIKSSQVDTKTSNEMPRGEQVILQRTMEGKMDLVEDCMPEELPPSGAPFSRAKRLGGRSDCNIKTLTCLRCRTRYTSLKTLNLHMMTVHAQRRTYFPCPFCETTFVQMWGVTRHLMTVHKKTKDQVDRLRGRIKRRAFVKNIETDTDMESGCRNNNSEENNDPISDLRHTLKYFKKQSQTNRNFQFHHCSKCWRVFGRQSSRISHEKFCFFSPKKTKKKIKSEKDSTKSLTSVCDNVKLKSNKTTKTNVIIKRQKKIIRSPKNGVLSCHLAQTRQPNLEEKVLALINSDTLTCQKCNRKFSTYSNLRRHVAIHVGWRRFKCKHCSYKAYNRSDCRNHVKRVHLGVGATVAKVERMIVHLPARNSTSIMLENKTSHNSAGHVTTPPCTRSLQLTSTKSKRKLSARTEIVKTNKRKLTSNGSQSEKHRNRRSKSDSSSRSSSSKTSPSDGLSNHNSCFPRHSSPSASYCEPSSISTLVTRAGIYPKKCRALFPSKMGTCTLRTEKMSD